MKKLLSIALLLGLGVAAGCSSDSSDGSGSTSSAATGCQQLKDCCGTEDAAFQSACNSGLTQANNNDQVCAGVVQDLQKSGHCGGGAAGSGGGGQAGSGQAGSGQAGSAQAGTGNTGGTSGAQAPECTTLEACCATFTAGVKDGCEHIVGLNNAGSCTSMLATYQKAGQCQPMAAKVPFSCDTSSSDHQCFSQMTDSMTVMYLQQGCKGTAGTSCPTANVVGCCTIAAANAVVCTYQGVDSPDELPMNCMNMGGTWSTMP